MFRQDKKMLTILLAALVFYLAFNSNIPVTDPVESNYALTAKEMLQSGDWLSPRIYGQYWYDKPVMIYWLIMGSYKLFGVNEFAARFPPAFFSALSILFTYWFAERIFHSRRTALLSVMVTATSLEYWVLSKMIITDAVLFFFNSVAMSCFYLGLLGQGRRWYVFAYAAAGLAVLTKGPVGLVLPGLIVFCYILICRRWEFLRRLFIVRGLLVFLAVAAPWYGYMIQVHGADFVDTFLGLHNYLRATVSEHPRDNVFYYYLVLFPVSMLPWTGMLLYMLQQMFKDRSVPHSSYLLSWAGITIAFYTLMATKYPTYVFPAIFPAALLIGCQLERMQRLPHRKNWWWLSAPAIILFVVLAGAKAFLPGAVHWWAVYLTAAAAIILTGYLQWTCKVYRLPETIAAAVVILGLLLVHNGLVPFSQTRSAQKIARQLPASGAMVASYGDYATSAVFYSGYVIPRLVQEQESQHDAHNVWSGKYTMPSETIQSFEAQARQHDATYVLVKLKDQNLFKNEPLGRHFGEVAAYGDMALYKWQTP